MSELQKYIVKVSVSVDVRGQHTAVVDCRDRETALRIRDNIAMKLIQVSASGMPRTKLFDEDMRPAQDAPVTPTSTSPTKRRVANESVNR